MSRPRNMLISVNGKVVSVPPSKLRSALSALSAGQTVDTTYGGKELGEVVMDLSNTTSDKAKELLARLFPETTNTTVSAPVLQTLPEPVIDF